jgi:hypothetical protein
MTVASLFSIPFYLVAAICIVSSVLILFGSQRRPGETQGVLFCQFLFGWTMAIFFALIGAMLQHL